MMRAKVKQVETNPLLPLVWHVSLMKLSFGSSQPSKVFVSVHPTWDSALKHAFRAVNYDSTRGCNCLLCQDEGSA